jgi:hypothetical protein
MIQNAGPAIKDGGITNTESRTLQKRPVVQNDTRIVEGPVLEKRPVRNPTSIEVAPGTLQKRPVIKNDNPTVEGLSRRNGMSETRRGALQKRPVIKNGGISNETGAVGNPTNGEGSVLEKRPEISNSTGRRT